MEETLSILLVNGDVAARLAVRRSLSEVGITADVIEAETCAAAIDLLQQQAVDVGLVGDRLPDGSALLLIQQMQQLDIGVPLIVLVEPGDEQGAIALMQAGAADCLANTDLSPSNLVRSLSSAVRLYRAERQAADVTRRLYESEERYRLVLEGSHDGIWDWYICRNEVFCNDRLLDIVGMTREAMGTAYDAFYQLIHPDDQSRVLKAITAHLKQGTAFDVELRLRHSSGSYRYCTSRGKAQHDEQKMLFRISGIVSDLTARKQAEDEITTLNRDLERRVRQQMQFQNLRLQEAAKLKSQFMATMSHELRTPMNAVIGFSQLLLRQQLLSSQRDMIDRILSNGRNLLALINDILDLSKIEAGRLELSLEPINLPQLVTVTVEELRSLVDQKQLTLDIQLTLQNPLIVNDRTRLRQILVNLLSNAIKFTEAGSVRVEVTDVEATDAEPEAIAITVQDTGVGIAEAHLAYIFEAFYQLDQTLAKRFPGTGLGLAITDLIVRQMNGTITVESKLGVGSTFRVQLPRRVEG